MKRRPGKGQRGKRAISAIIGGVFVFVIVFSVVAAYFVFDYNAQTSIDMAANEQALRDSQASSQNFTVFGSFTQTSPLTVNITNTGPVAIQIAAIMTVSFPTSNKILGINNLSCTSSCNTNQKVIINPGNWTVLSTNYNWPGGPILIEVTTTLGTTISTIYPPNVNVGGGGNPFASLTSQTIGDIFLDFRSYTFYTITKTGCSGTPTPQDTSYCLEKPSQAFTICCGTQQGNLTNNPIAFSVRVRNVNPAFLNITLDGFSQFFQFFPQGSSLRSVFWYIISVDNSTGGAYIVNDYNPTSGFLPNTYNQTVAPEVTLFFANSDPGGAFAPVLPSGSNALPAPELVSTFIFAHGWKGNGTNANTLIQKIGVQNYGQNIPFVTTKYCDTQTDTACYK